MNASKKLWLFVSVLAILLAGTGITYAWFSHNAALTTLMEIQPSDTITIVPVSGTDSSQMIEMDLDYDENRGDTTDEDGRIHVERYICVKSTNDVHRLEVVHTTNLQSLNFQIFPAVRNTPADASSPISVVNGTAAILGNYVNQDPSDPSRAKEEILENYQSTADVADFCAYPLYWLQTGDSRAYTSYPSDEFDPVHNAQFNYTYYCLKIDWLEETKETDLFYIMAQTIA